MKYNTSVKKNNYAEYAEFNWLFRLLVNAPVEYVGVTSKIMVRRGESTQESFMRGGSVPFHIRFLIEKVLLSYTFF